MSKLLNFFSHRSIAAKLAIMTAAGVVSMVLVALTVLLIARAQLVTERTEKAHAIVDAVWHRADSYYNAGQKGEMTPEEARKRFLRSVDSIWYENHSNFVFIYDYETGIAESDAGVPTLLGKDMRNVKD